MPFISVTRLRLRSIRFVPGFMGDARRSTRQLSEAPGFLRGALLMDRRWTFWTLTAWDGEAEMRRYMLDGPHRAAMPRLAIRCDEASVVHWEQPEDRLPAWSEADARMRGQGRPSRVDNPSPRHAGLTYARPRTLFSGPIKAAARG